MESLIDRLLLRPLPIADDVLQLPAEELVNIGGSLGIYVSMDEVEENLLDDLPLRVQEGILRLRPLKLAGYLRMNTDNLDRLLRILNHSEVFLSSFSFSGSYFTADGWHTPEVTDYVSINLEEILTNTRARVVGTLVLSWSRKDELISLLCENVEIAGHLADPFWRGKYTTTLTTRTVTFALEAIQAETTEIHNYLIENHQWHRAVNFRSVPEANHTFLVPYLQERLSATPLTLRTIPTGGDGRNYSLQYYVSGITQTQLEVYDRLLTVEMGRLLSETGFLRYFATTPNPLEAVFLELEDLIPAPDTYLVAPGDRPLQQYYATIQDYNEETAFQQVLLRRQQFLTTRQITHRLQQRWTTANRSAAWHVLARYLSKVIDTPTPVLEGDLLIIHGNILALSDALAIYILMLQAQREASRPLHLYLRWLASLEGEQLPSELVTFLAQAPQDGAYAEPTCSLVPSCTVQSCPLPVAPCKAPPTQYYVIQLPYHQYTIVSLRGKGDAVPLHYWTGGEEKHYISLYSDKLYYPDDLRDCYDFQQPSVIKLPQTIVNSQDYKLDITMVGDYYRLDVVAIPNDKPVDRWTICYLPIWVGLEYPRYLDKILWLWKRGRLLTPESRIWYRRTRKLWGSNSIALLYKDLTPNYWQLLGTQQTLDRVHTLLG